MTSREPKWKLNLLMLWFSQLLVMGGYSAMIPFIPLFMKNELHITGKGDLAFYVAMFNFFGTLAYALFCPLWGKLADRFGVKPMLLRGTFVTAFIFPVMGYVSNVWMLIFLRFLSAACAGTTAASQIMIARNTPDNKQGFAQGVLTTAIWGGAMLGNVVGGFIIYYFDYKVAFWICGILYFIAGFSILFTREEFTAPVKGVANLQVALTFKDHLRHILPSFTRAVWLIYALLLLCGIVRYLEVPFIALQVESLCDPKTASYWTGITSAVVCCGAIFSGVLGGYLSDKLSPRTLLIPIMLISAVAMILQGMASSLWLFAASRTLLYVAAGGIQPILQKILSGVTPARKRGTVFGFASTAMQSGIMLASVFGGWTMYICGLRGVFYISGIMFVLVLPIFLSFLSVAMNQRFYRLYTLKDEKK